ncbi:ABC transporter G member 22 [Quaeritorhiza haematococci]|nr:ABC transporter G member 22 [Quaeritorhiza haematococci]
MVSTWLPTEKYLYRHASLATQRRDDQTTTKTRWANRKIAPEPANNAGNGTLAAKKGPTAAWSQDARNWGGMNQNQISVAASTPAQQEKTLQLTNGASSPKPVMDQRQTESSGVWLAFQSLRLTIEEKVRINPQSENDSAEGVSGDPAIEEDQMQEPEAPARRKKSPEYKIVPRDILKNVTGFAKPGTITAIMGPSGCGKTTLLDLLAGRNPSENVQGTILINGKTRSQRYMKRISAYVIQTDALFSNLTVREILMYTVELRVPVSVSAEEKMQRVEQVMHELELSHVADTKVGRGGDDAAGGDARSGGGLSGGQKRRLSIAIELVTSPAILFLDEPTTGLDAYTSLRLMLTLKRLAEKDKTIICTINQPRSDIFEHYFEEQGMPIPASANVADFVVDLTYTKEDDDQLKLLLHRQKLRKLRHRRGQKKGAPATGVSQPGAVELMGDFNAVNSFDQNGSVAGAAGATWSSHGAQKRRGPWYPQHTRGMKPFPEEEENQGEARDGDQNAQRGGNSRQLMQSGNNNARGGWERERKVSGKYGGEYGMEDDRKALSDEEDDSGEENEFWDMSASDDDDEVSVADIWAHTQRMKWLQSHRDLMDKFYDQHQSGGGYGGASYDNLSASFSRGNAYGDGAEQGYGSNSYRGGDQQQRQRDAYQGENGWENREGGESSGRRQNSQQYDQSIVRQFEQEDMMFKSESKSNPPMQNRDSGNNNAGGQIISSVAAANNDQTVLDQSVVIVRDGDPMDDADEDGDDDFLIATYRQSKLRRVMEDQLRQVITSEREGPGGTGEDTLKSPDSYRTRRNTEFAPLVPTSDQKKESGTTGKSYATSFFHQIQTLIRRSGRNFARSKRSFFGGFALASGNLLFYGILYLGLIVQNSIQHTTTVKNADGTVTTMIDNSVTTRDDYKYVQSQKAFMFQVVTGVCLLELDVLAKAFFEKTMFFRENAAGSYSSLSYHLSWYLRLQFFGLIRGILYPPFCYFLSGMTLSIDSYIYFCLVVTLMSTTGSAIALLLVSAIPALEGAASAYSAFIGTMATFAGFFFLPRLIPPWFTYSYYLSFYKYALEGLYWSEFFGRVVILTSKNSTATASAMNVQTVSLIAANANPNISDVSLMAVNNTQPTMTAAQTIVLDVLSMLQVDSALNRWTNLLYLMVFPLAFHLFAYMATALHVGARQRESKFKKTMLWIKNMRKGNKNQSEQEQTGDGAQFSEMGGDAEARTLEMGSAEVIVQIDDTATPKKADEYMTDSNPGRPAPRKESRVEANGKTKVDRKEMTRTWVMTTSDTQSASRREEPHRRVTEWLSHTLSFPPRGSTTASASRPDGVNEEGGVPSTTEKNADTTVKTAAKVGTPKVPKQQQQLKSSGLPKPPTHRGRANPPQQQRPEGNRDHLSNGRQHQGPSGRNLHGSSNQHAIDMRRRGTIARRDYMGSGLGSLQARVTSSSVSNLLGGRSSGFS